MPTVNSPAMALAGDGTVAEGKQRLPFVIAASSAGTLIEFYDFYLYGVLASFFAAHFFPGDLRNGFLFSLGIFWTASSCVRWARCCSAIWAI